ADVLHTLGEVALKQGTPGGVLRGVVRTREPLALERFAAKMIVENTLYSTLADLAGNFEFRNLPAGHYKLIAFRAGNRIGHADIAIRNGETNTCQLVLEPADNLLRNGDFAIHWKESRSADCWDLWQGTWNGEIIPLKIDQKYRVSANFKENTDGEVILRWTRYLPHAVPRTTMMPLFQSKKLTPNDSAHEFVASENFGLLQLSLKSSGRRPEELLNDVQ